VYEVPPQSVVVLRGVRLDGPDLAAVVRDEIESAVGHAEFAVLFLAEGAVSVWGPDDDLRERVRSLIRDGLFHRRHEPAPVVAPDAVHGPVVTSSEQLRGRATGQPR
jgi:hypothetical protein